MNPFLLMISTTPIASGAMSVLMVLETVSSDLTFFSGLSTHISLYGHIYLSLFGCFWGFSNWTNPKLLSMYHLSLLPRDNNDASSTQRKGTCFLLAVAHHIWIFSIFNFKARSTLTMTSWTLYFINDETRKADRFY